MPIQESLQVVVQKLQDKFGDSILSVQEFRDEVTVRFKPQVWVEAHRFLKEDEDCAFNMLIDETAADYPLRTERFDVITHLLSLGKAHRLRVKTQTAEHIPTLYPVWKTANWLERETYDLFGIIFDGHPDLRRILLTEDWEGFPLRKDYPIEGYDI
jgi:NADH-quinone oxidoreductase subunit C